MNARLGTALAIAALAVAGVVASCLASSPGSPSGPAMGAGQPEARPEATLSRSGEAPRPDERTTEPRPGADASGPAPEPGATAAVNISPRQYVVAAIGDSLTDERSYAKSYVAQLRAACPKSRFDNYGVGGNMVNQMRRRFVSQVFSAGHPSYTHVIVFGGVNDIYSDQTAGRTPEKISRDLSTMYHEARARGARVIALTVAPWAGFRAWYNPSRAAATQEVNRFIHAALTGGQVDAVVDTGALLSCGDAERLCDEVLPPFKDGLHFGEAGHARLAEALRAQVFTHCE